MRRSSSEVWQSPLMGQYNLGAPIAQLTRHPPMDRSTERRRTVGVLLDDPAAAALSLHTYMQPTHLMQLLLIHAPAAADTLRDRHKTRGACPIRSARTA